MRASSMIPLSVLAAVAVAAPTNIEDRSLLFCTAFTDSFDDLPASSLTQQNPVGTYHGVTYQGFAVDSKSPTTGSTGGVVPHSGNQDAGANLASNAVQMGSVTLNPFGNIVASPNRAFDLYSFYFGCGAASQNSGVSTAIGCTIAVTGVDYFGNQLPVQTYAFAPTSNTAAPMVLATLPYTYNHLASVTFGVANGLPAGTQLFLDDVRHCNYS